MHKEGHTNELKIRATTNKIRVKLSFLFVPASRPVCAEQRAASKPNKLNVRLRRVEKQRIVFLKPCLFVPADSCDPRQCAERELSQAGSRTFIQILAGNTFSTGRPRARTTPPTGFGNSTMRDVRHPPQEAREHRVPGSCRQGDVG